MRHAVGTLLLALAGLAACNNTIEIDQNEAPIAVGNDDMAQPANLPVFLDGRASYDADGDDLVFHWTIDHAPEASGLMDLTDPFSPNHSTDSATTRFQPDARGTYVVELRTYDGEYYSDPTYIIIEAEEPTDVPVANCGRDQYLALGETATLDGGQSVDPLGGVLDYEWSLVRTPSGSALEVVSPDDARSTSLSADVPGAYVVSLVVSNDQADSEPSSCTIFFEGDNQAPTADAGDDFPAMDCSDVPLDCSSSSDPDDDSLFYWWTIQAVPDGSAVDNRSISNQNAARPDIFFDEAGEYQVACSVYDGQAWSKPDVITVSVDERDFNSPPIIDAGPDRVIDLGTVECDQTTSPYYPYPLITTCDKCGSSTVTQSASVGDPDGDPFTLQWNVIKDSKVRLRGDVDELEVNIESPTLAPDSIGTIVEEAFVELVAEDCTHETAQDEITIETTCQAVLD